MKKNLLVLFSFMLMSHGWAQVKPTEPPAATKLKRSIEVGRVQESDDKNLTVYPNPTTGIVNLSLTGFNGKRTTLSVVNVIGTVVYQEILPTVDGRVNKSIDLSKQANGLYYIKLDAEDYSEIRKIVLK
ncbi:T9SS type A sorting domain-containing protein [Adhaeribacter terreus]|uniref:T9SS type A sorting domain-containing protein n=1 Tax=Adhaeribacter terreus TaxID=529703 RepID=A0ABW0EA42_9BACT